FFIGNIRHTTGFFIMYGLHILTALGAVITGFILDIGLLLPQIHFIIITLIGVILLPFHLFNRNRQERLEGLLEQANERISELVVVEERQRIARDLHDTLGQKLSMIGLKSDLASRLTKKEPDRAIKELKDIRVTASTALEEVRELVTNMRFKKLDEEIVRIKQILKAANIKLMIHGEGSFSSMHAMTENVMSMCMKEAATNIVKHSFANQCTISFLKSENEFM